MSETGMVNAFRATNYGDVLAVVYDLRLLDYRESHEHGEGYFLAVLTDEERLFYFVDIFGSCSGCDWLQDVGKYYDTDTLGNPMYYIPYKEARNYCGGIKPLYIVPKDMPLKMEWQETGWVATGVNKLERKMSNKLTKLTGEKVWEFKEASMKLGTTIYHAIIRQLSRKGITPSNKNIVRALYVVDDRKLIKLMKEVQDGQVHAN